MDETRDLLIEIGTEELPPRSLGDLSRAFGQAVRERLVKAGLHHGEIRLYATPRRLALLIRNLVTRQADRITERRGPALTAAFDAAGRPTQAATGFARSCGVAVEALETMATEKGTWLAHRVRQQGRAARTLIPGLLEEALTTLPISKRMRWGALSVEFVRPVHWLVVLFGDEVIPTELLGVSAGRGTRGHRFHHPDFLHLSEPAAYASLLETEGHVLADFAGRRAAVAAQVEESAHRVGGKALLDEALLDEVTGLVEWPVALLGDFEPRFLAVPAEALISTMKGNQKYFPITNERGDLLPHFVAVSNIDSRDPLRVKEGNQRVVRPRLADAAFFWDKDRRTPLEQRLDSLRSVVFQEKLGSLFDKAQRLATLGAFIAATLGADERLAYRAGLLCKCDLVTDMVAEFPELQGIMGRYYAREQGETEEVARALEEHYLPRGAGDALPEHAISQAIAVADRLDALVGIFGIGAPPSGDKDPFALRRAALGSLRIIIERKLDLDLERLLNETLRVYGERLLRTNTASQVFDFMVERLRAYYLESGVRSDEFEAVAATRPTRPLDFHRRIHAVNAFRRLPQAASLSAANKRIQNILRQATESIPDAPEPTLLETGAEKTLAQLAQGIAQEIEPMIAMGDYQMALTRLAGLREPIDRFFDVPWSW